MDDCIFCKMVKGEIPINKIYEDEYCLAFFDIKPMAKKHALLIPKTHVKNLNELDQLSEAERLGLLNGIAKAAEALDIKESGFRLASNCGEHACQSVMHLHFHILGGEQLSLNMV